MFYHPPPPALFNVELLEATWGIDKGSEGGGGWGGEAIHVRCLLSSVQTSLSSGMIFTTLLNYFCFGFKFLLFRSKSLFFFVHRLNKKKDLIPSASSRNFIADATSFLPGYISRFSHASQGILKLEREDSDLPDFLSR